MKNNKLSYTIAILFFVLGCYYAFLFQRYLDEKRFIPIANGEFIHLYDSKKKIFYSYEYEGYLIDMKGLDRKYYEPKDLK